MAVLSIPPPKKVPCQIYVNMQSPHIFATYFAILWSAYFEKNVRIFLTCLNNKSNTVHDKYAPLVRNFTDLQVSEKYCSTTLKAELQMNTDSNRAEITKYAKT